MRIPSWFLIATLLALLITCDKSSELEHNTPQNSIETEPLIETSSNYNIPEMSPTLAPVQFSAVGFSNDIADLVESVEASVVFISAEIETESFFFGKTVQESSGSGVIVDSDGYIITNNHVVEGASNINVTLPGIMNSFSAEIVGTDPLTDLAVLKIQGDEFPTVLFGDASKLRPGNLVIAMGYPLALSEGATITLGVVSNTERAFTVGDSTYYDVIQTDAAINRGNSGGPLLDLEGNIVGINSVLFGGAQNIGFAISAHTARFVYDALVGETHRVIRPWLGVELLTVTPDIAVDVDLPKQSGAVITYVVPNSPADVAGLKVKDVITQFGGRYVESATQLIRDLWQMQVGDEVNLTYWRDAEENFVAIELSVERPD